MKIDGSYFTSSFSHTGTLDPVSKTVTALSNYTTIQLKMNGDHISASIDIDARNGNNSSVCHLKGDKDL